jgi:hypothetical protein
MTEAEWLACSDSAPMLAFIRRGAAVLVDELPTQSERDAVRRFLQESLTRKLRLFACWCCRRIWKELVDKRSRKAVEMTEHFVDGLATEAQLLAAHEEAFQARQEMSHTAVASCRLVNFHEEAFQAKQEMSTIRGNHIRYIAAHMAHGVSGYETVDVTAESAEVLVRIGTLGTLRRAQTEQAQALHCVLGNLFRPVAPDPGWRTSDVTLLAQGIYDEHAFERMSILADALQDAGCDNTDILSHCRDTSTPHTRGCWVVDLVLGKS